jgi:AAA+ ATPase superfamily predicted ATPase
MINFKQKELIRSFFNSVKDKFPETEFLSVTESPENPADLWINITEPGDEDREIELIEFASDKTVDILLDYGYHISVMPRTMKEAEFIKQYPQTQSLCMA